jgi:hypothetical protein
MRNITSFIRTILIIIFSTLLIQSCKQNTQKNDNKDSEELIEGLGLTQQEVIESWIYSFARYMVILQEHIDIAEEGVDYNVIKYNELGKAEFPNPNLDVAYMETWFAVDENTPAILEIPKVEGRYYTAQICDEWAEILYNINERNFPKHPYGKYAICLKGSNPEIPEDALRLDIPSKKAKMLARVERMGDDAGAIALQKAFKVYSLGEPKIEQIVDIPMFTNREPLTVQVFDSPMIENVLKSAPDANTEHEMYQKNALTIAGFVAKNSTNREMIDVIIKQKAIPAVFNFIKNFGDKRGGWSSTREYLKFGNDIWFRCAANFAGIWWNSSSEVVYYIGEKDSNDMPLNGDNVYVIHYKPEDLPQKRVNAYWSLTLMSLPDYRVIPNEMNRFNLNNISELTLEEDGSLKLYLAAELPKGVHNSNWLPTPKGKPFTLNHRLYVPKKEVLNGEYYLPELKRLN